MTYLKEKPSQGQALFSTEDIEYLVAHFTLPQLRHEHHRAEVEKAVCSQFGDPDIFFWKSYQETVGAAMSIKRSDCSPRTRKGRGRLPRADDVKTKSDIVDVVGQRVPLQKCGRYFKGLCPFHTEKHASFFVFPESQRARCFGCGWAGDVITFIEDYHGLSFREAIRYLSEGVP